MNGSRVKKTGRRAGTTIEATEEEAKILIPIYRKANSLMGMREEEEEESCCLETISGAESLFSPRAAFLRTWPLLFGVGVFLTTKWRPVCCLIILLCVLTNDDNGNALWPSSQVYT